MIEPIGNRVIVRRDDSEDIIGGIVVRSSERKGTGEVVSCGPASCVSVGERVIFGRSGMDMKVDGERLVVMLDTDIMGVLE